MESSETPGMVRRLTRNAMRCDGCGDVIESKHHHDFKYCTCRALAVDGGLSYNRFLFRNEVPYTNLCEYEEIPCPRHWFPTWETEVNICLHCGIKRGEVDGSGI